MAIFEVKLLIYIKDEVRMKLRMKSSKSPWQHIKKQRHYFTNKGPSCQGYGFFQKSHMDVRAGL